MDGWWVARWPAHEADGRDVAKKGEHAAAALAGEGFGSHHNIDDRKALSRRSAEALTQALLREGGV